MAKVVERTRRSASLRQVGVAVVGTTGTPEEALALVQQHQPALLVAEINFPQGAMDGVSCVREAKRWAPELKVIVLSGDARSSRIDAAFDAGATAYVVKTVRADDLASAIRQVFDHSMYFAPARVSRAMSWSSRRRS